MGNTNPGVNAAGFHPSDGQFWERHFVPFSQVPRDSRPYIDLSSSPASLLSEITSQINNQHSSLCPNLCFRGTPCNTTNFLGMNIWVVAGFCHCKTASKNVHVKPTDAQVQEFLLCVYIGVDLLGQRLRLKFIL